MSNDISKFLRQYPLLITYAKKGLINLNALAEYIKENNHEIKSSVSLAAIGMSLRRYLSKLPNSSESPSIFAKYSLHIVARSNISEYVINKNIESKAYWTKFLSEISKSLGIISIVEGEKEIVIMADKLIPPLKNNKYVTNHNEGLSYLSINFPNELRYQPGIYSVLTSSLAEANISVHSFHTIGGEILILVKDHDLTKTHEILQTILCKKD